MTTNERRINAYMRFHGYTRKEAEAAVRAKPNPTNAPKAAKKRLSKKRYVNRPSQAGEQRAPTARLKARRKANLSAPKGVFPNPSKKWDTFSAGTNSPGNRPSYQLITDHLPGGRSMFLVDPIYTSGGKFVGFSLKSFGIFSSHWDNHRTFVSSLAARRYAERALREGAFPDTVNGAKSNPLKPGITARPRKGKTSVTRSMLSVDHAKTESGPWTIAGIFPNRQLAADYAKAMADLNPRLWWRVATL